MLEDVRDLVRAGFAVHILRPKSKIPLETAWASAKVLSYPELKRKYRKGYNLGVRLGEPSCVDGAFLHAIDLDIRKEKSRKTCLNKLKELFPNTKFARFPRVQSGSGGSSRHIYFLSEHPLRTKKLAHSEESYLDSDGKKHWYWEIELFGTGKQVAMPPSIHPDTGEVYRWLQEPDDLIGIPFIPEEILDGLLKEGERSELANEEPLGMSIDAARDYLDHLQDWADDRETWVRVGMALKHEFSDDPDLLEEAWELFDAWSSSGRGYDKKENRVQWRSFKVDRDEVVTMRSVAKPARERGLIEAFDTFDEGELEEGGGSSEFDGQPEPMDKRDLRVIFERMEEREARGPNTVEGQLVRQGIPEKYLSIPGVLQEFVDYYNATAKKPQPQFAVQGALAFASVVMGRVWNSGRASNYTSLYFLNLGKTSTGKEHVKFVIENILEAAGLGDLIGPKTYSSEAGVLSTLMVKPRHISIADEFGRYLGSSRSGSNANKADMQSSLMELFGRCDGIYQGIGYSTRGMTKEQVDAQQAQKITRPALTLLGMTTPSTFYKALGQADVADGFLNRFLVVDSPLARSRDLIPFNEKPPKRLVKWARDVAWQTGADDDDMESLRAMADPAFAPTPAEIPFSRRCFPILDDISDDVIGKMDDLDESGLAELFGRSREITMRVALIVAASDGCSHIEPKHLEWARGYVFFYHGRMIDAFQNNVGVSDENRVAREIAERVNDAGSTGIPTWRLYQRVRAFDKMDDRSQREVLNRLKNTFSIEIMALRAKGGRGPMSKKFINTTHVKQ